MSGTTEAFSRVKIDALLKDAGWNLTDGSSVLFEYSLQEKESPASPGRFRFRPAKFWAVWAVL